MMERSPNRDHELASVILCRLAVDTDCADDAAFRQPYMDHAITERRTFVKPKRADRRSCRLDDTKAEPFGI
jgi:hypothetical protein